MGCCGKAVSMGEGYIKFFLESAFHLEKETNEARVREKICMSDKCGKLTWIKKKDYISWMVKNAKGIVKEFNDLSKLPELPKIEKYKGHQPFCTLCKCFVPAKVRSKSESCPRGKW